MHHHHPVAMLIVAVAQAFAFAFLYLVVMTLTLPSTDMAYGSVPLSDPLEWLVMSVVASIAALITYPFFYFALRDRRSPRAPVILACIVALEIILVTPFNAGLGFYGAFVAYFLGLLIARRFTIRL